ncbi:MAG: NAD(P)H-quinone oxidoreductase [Cyclobacteriaceae bacterium]|nr:NAD(P)H-quinone oxidoreductase [Cyclobacteriaceae bacterium]
MKAVVITQPGDSGVLQIEERPMPSCGGDDVLVRVAAAGVNRPDIAQRKGRYPAPKGAPADIPGLEIAGEIVEVGSRVGSWKVGDKVCALVPGGGYAEYAAVPAGLCLPVPKGLSLIQAAALPETFFTVWSNVVDRGRYVRGESLLVHGGTSGIGVTTIQMVKALGGGAVYATAGTDEKCRYCESLGAERGINYKTENFRDVILSVTDGRGVDIILDMIGGPYTEPNLECLAEEGRLVLINYMKGDETTIHLSHVLRKRLTITGSTLRARSVEFKAAIAQNLRMHIWPLLESGAIKPVVYKVFSMAEAPAAHDLMQSSEHMGKIVLEWA